MKKKVVIFDFDGVIVDSIPLSYSINRRTIPGLEYQEWQSWFEGNVYKTIRKECANDVYQDAFFEEYYQGLVELVPIDGMKQVIRELSKKYSLVIVSSTTQKSIKDFLKIHGLDGYFQEVLGKETHKSKVDKINMIVNKYMIRPDETLIITDTLGDIREANEVGTRSLGVTWGIHNYDKLSEANPNIIATKPGEVIEGVDLVLNLAKRLSRRKLQTKGV